MDEQLRVDLQASDSASQNIQRVMDAFDRLRAKVEAANAEFEQVFGRSAPAQAMERAMEQATRSMATALDRFGANAEATFVRLTNNSQVAFRQMEEAADRAAQREIDDMSKIDAAKQAAREREAAALEKLAQTYIAIDKRRTETIHAQMAAHVEAYLAGNRQIAESAQQTAEQQIVAGRRAERELEAFDQKLAQHVQKQAQAEARSREETFFLAQAANQKLIADDEKRAQAEIQAVERVAQAERKYREDLFFFVQEQNQKLEQEETRRLQHQAQQEEQAAARRNSALRNVAGGALGGVGNVLGGAGGAIGGVLGALGGAAQSGLSMLLTPVKAIGEAFVGMAGSIAGAGREMVNLTATAAGLYGVYQIVMQLQQSFTSLAHGVLDFQDVMVRVSSLTGATTGEMTDMSAAILQVSMQTGRSASELGEAMYFIESHGVKGADALNILTNAGKLAAAGLGETNQIVRVVAGQMLAYNEVLDGTARSQAVTAHYFDVFARTVQISAVPAQEVAATFARITPLAAALHIGIEELGADFATISQTGLNASRVMTDLIAVFNNFLKGGKQQQEALQGIGLSVDTVRKTLGEHGLIAAAEQIWQAADRDINAVSQVFGDRTRALVGYLALVEDGGKRADENLRQMQNSAGKTAAVFEAALTRVSIQWQRFTNIIQAFAIVAGSNLLGPLAADMNKINDALQRADFSAAGDAIVVAFQHVGETVMGVLDSLGKSMFGSGMSMMEALAGGIIQGINTVLNAAVNAVADFIASFLLGHSWPPRGPLAQGNTGVQRWQQEYASAMLSNGTIMTGAAANVATQVNAELGKIGGGPNSKVGLELAIAGIDQQLLPWKLAVEDIKNTYEAQLHPLERQIAAIQRIKDLEYERQQLGFEQRDLELRMMRIRAEGDPHRRAELAGQLARLQEQREQHSIESRLATLNREAGNLKPGRGTSPQEIALRRREIADEVSILRVQQQQHRLVNVQLLGQYETKKQQLDVDKEGAKISHDAFELQQKQTLQPLLEQRDKLKFQEQAELDIIDEKTQGLENQRKILEAHLRLVNAITSANKAGAGGGAGPWKMPDTAGVGEDLGAGMAKAMQKNIGDLAEAFSKRLSGGITAYFDANGSRLGAGLVGTIVGGMVLGLPGAIAGAAFGPRLLDALEERGVTGADYTHIATSIVAELRNSFGRITDKLRAGDILGSVEALMVDAQGWIREFQTRFFSQWYVASTTGPGGSEVTYTRYTGIGRQIVEAIRGEMIEGPLDFDSLRTAMSTLMGRIWGGLTSQQITFDPITKDPSFGASPIQQMLIMGLKGADFVLGVVGAAADSLSTVFRNLVTNESVNKAAHDLGKNIGVLIMGGTPDGLASEEGTSRFVDGIRKLDRAMLDAGTTLAKSLVAGFFEGIAKEFSLEGMGAHVVPGSFLDRVMKGEDILSALRGGITNAVSLQTTPQGPTMQPGGMRQSASGAAVVGGEGVGGGGVGGTWAMDAPTGLFGTQGPLAKLGTSWLAQLPEIGTNAVKGLISGLTDAGVMGALETAGLTIIHTFLDAVIGSQGLRAQSPSQAMADIGRDAVDGFNAGIADASSLTGPVVRMWLRSEVIAQAQQILITGEGKSGGLRGVARDALDGFSEAFASPPAGLAQNMRAIGVTVTEAIMDPIEDPRTGVIARMRRAIDAMPKPRAPAPTEGGGGGGDRNIMAATGADFTVGGSGGTDSEHISLWASPGERVQVGASNSSRQVNNHFNITVNGGDPDAVRQAIADGIAQGQGDQDGGNEFINAWRMAKQQGANKPIGFPTRRTRG